MKFETAILDILHKILRKDTGSAFNADLHSNEALRGAIDNLSISGSVDVESIGGVSVTGPDDLKADVSGLATTAELATHDGKLDMVDGLVDSIKLKTDLIPAQPASQSDVTAVSSKVDTVDGLVDAIKLQTDQLFYSGANVQARVADKGVLNDLSGADATTACASALSTYDPPNKSELDSAVSPLALEATLIAIKGAGWTTETLKAIKDAIDALEPGGSSTPESPYTASGSTYDASNWSTIVNITSGSGTLIGIAQHMSFSNNDVGGTGQVRITINGSVIGTFTMSAGQATSSETGAGGWANGKGLAFNHKFTSSLKVEHIGGGYYYNGQWSSYAYVNTAVSYTRAS
ncbi:MAG: hypothetical protein ACYC3W_10550 [Candidatus Nanopelagicales bacterium]